MKHYLFFILFFLSFGLFAQNASIEGFIFDKTANVPLEFASVSLFNHLDSSLVNGQIANGEGRFKFTNLRSGSYFIKIQFVGFESYRSSTLNLLAGQSLKLGIIELFLSQKFLAEVKVSGQELKSLNKIDKQVFKADQFESARGGTAIDVIKNMPSITVDGQGEISLRGSKGFLVLINGKAVQTDAATILSQLPANTIENIELITAPSAKNDPDGKGGIINITTQKGADNSSAFIANIQGGLPSTIDYGNKENQQRYGADIAFNYKRNKLDFSFGANYLRNDNAGFRDGDVFTIIGPQKTSFPSKGERSFDKYNYGGRFNVTFIPSDKNQLSLGFFAGHKFQDRVADIYYRNSSSVLATGQIISRYDYFNANTQNKQGDFILGNIDYSHKFDEKTNLTVSALVEHAGLNGSTKNRNFEGQEIVQNTLSTYKNPLTGFRVKADLSKMFGDSKLESGYQYRLDQQDGSFIYSVRERGVANFIVNNDFSGDVLAKNHIHSFYSQFSGKSDKLEYLAGLRYEYSSRDLNVRSSASDDYGLTLDNLFPSASIFYQLKNNWKMKAGISRRVQRTNNFELNPIPEREHSETLERGDANLLPEFIYLAEVGLSRNFSKGSIFSTIYFQDIKNPIQRVNNVFADTILNRVYTNADKAKRVGVELGLNYNPVNWAQIYFGTNVYKSSLSGLILNYSNLQRNSAWVNSFNFNMNFQLNSRLSIQANMNYISARPTVQGEDSRFYTPNMSIKKSFFAGRLNALLQWQNIDMGLLNSNEQRITTSAPDFYTTTNYIYEVDVLMINLSFNLNRLKNKIKLPGSEFGEKEF